MRRLFSLLLALPLSALADPAAAPAATPLAGSGIGGQLVQLLLGLLLVVGLIFALAWVMRRVQQFGPRGGQVIKLVASQALGPRDRLLLVQVGGEQILLGISAGRISPLHVLKEPVALGEAEPATPEFAQRLMELLGKDNKDKT
ncbi:flagellar biosynthetic protein FliO [Pseudomonas sp. R-28-1W-6]|uniref:flagellar biosynthetic protein FliO n=1 Tax=Pseudomonas sp. R-28-1W-6 TaxID=2650101 RepID=UPI00136628A1|nr:flagellar biosynthetic protein FliO [Pseudomonas sp. R-28-1W-6]MWV12583.1 flagellar biosynthetic protein FliO [Pseudomonas sp. R-28-1W-6]